MKRSCVAMLGVLALWPSRALAAPGDATRLEYARSELAAACPDREALKSAVKQRLGYDPFFPAARQAIVVEITDLAGQLRAGMRLSDENGMIVGSRELEGPLDQCDELVASLALAISIALDPSAALGTRPPVASASKTQLKEASDTGVDQDPDLESPPPPAATNSREARPQPKSAAPASAPRKLHSSARASGFAALGTSPSLAPGFRVGLGVRYHWLKVVAEFAEQFASQRTVESGGSVRASLYEAAFTTCVVQSIFAGCALFDLGSLQSEGRGIPTPAARSTLYAAVGARFELEPRLIGPLYFLLNADVSKTLSPTTLRLRGEEVWQTPFAALALGAGLALHFP